MKAYKLGQYVEVEFNLNNGTTGDVDADSTPTYRVYEGSNVVTANDTVIATGNCSKKDDSNTLGAYVARPELTGSYTAGKIYSVRATAVIGGNTWSCWVGSFIVLPAKVYDSLVAGSDNLEVDQIQIGGDAQSSTDAKDFFDTGYNPVTHKVVGVVTTDTATNLSNLPAIPNNWITAAGIQADAFTAAKFAADVAAEFQNGLATATALTAVQTDITTLLGRLTASRAGYLDNLNTGGVVASQNDINALNQSASRRLIISGLNQKERPEAGSVTFDVEVRTYDGDGAAVNADSTPTLTALGNISGSLNANLSAASNPATGLYRWTYTVASAHALEQIRFDVSALIGASTFTISLYSQVVDFVAATWTTTNQAQLAAIFNKLPSKNFLSGSDNSNGSLDAGDLADINAQSLAAINTYDPPTKAEFDAAVALLATSSSLATLINRIGGFTGTGDNTLLGVLRAMASKTAPTPSDIGGTFASGQDSLESIRDRGDAEWGAGAVPTVQEITDGVLDAMAADHNDPDTIGAKINASGASGDPLANAVPGSYPVGTAGYVLGTLVVTTFSTPVPEPDECIETLQFDVGEKKRVFAMISAGVGNLTIQGTPKVTLLNRSAQAVNGVNNINVTGSDVGALSSVRAWYDLDTATPPSGGAIAPGKYTLCFSITVLKSGGGTETRVIKQPIKVDPLA